MLFRLVIGLHLEHLGKYGSYGIFLFMVVFPIMLVFGFGFGF